MKTLSIALCTLFCTCCMTTVDAKPTRVSKSKVKTDAKDTALFLTPFVANELKNVSGKMVLDAGCGTGEWTLAAANEGADAHGIEGSTQLLEQAQLAAMHAGLAKQTHFAKLDEKGFPYDTSVFEQALSVNVGSTLCATKQTLTSEGCYLTGLGAYLQECARVLQDHGKMIISAPASYDIVFTDGTQSPEEVTEQIETMLVACSEDCDCDEHELKEKIANLQGVCRATFALRDGRPLLVKNVKDLNWGERIFRKTPDGVSEEFYHSEEEYLIAINGAGLKCTEIKRPCFFGKVKYDQFLTSLEEGESSLGESYMDNHPFTIYYVEK